MTKQNCDLEKTNQVWTNKVSEQEFAQRLKQKSNDTWRLRVGQQWHGISSHYWIEHVCCGHSIFILAKHFVRNVSNVDHLRKCPFCEKGSPLQCINGSVSVYQDWLSHVTNGGIKLLSEEIPTEAEEIKIFQCLICASSFEASQNQVLKQKHHGCSECSERSKKKLRALVCNVGVAERRGYEILSNNIPSARHTIELKAPDGEIIKTSLLDLCREYPLYADGFRKKQQLSNINRHWEHTNSGKTYTEADIAWLNDNKNKLNYWEMGMHLGRSEGSIKNQFRNLGWSNDERENYGRLTTLDDSSFDIITPEAAYWAGFIAADGCLKGALKGKAKGFKIDVIVEDELHLGTLLKFLEADNALHYRTSKQTKGRNIYVGIDITSSRIYEKLMNIYNLTANKSLTLNPPNIADETCITAYMLGFFDGDGHISYYDANKFNVQLGCASYEFMEWYVAQIKRMLGKKHIEIYTKNKNVKNPFHHISLHTNEAKMFLYTLYSSVDLALVRKKAKFLKYVERDLKVKS